MKRFLTVIIMLAVPIIILSANAFADEGHCAEMKKQAQEAVDHGKAGHAGVLVEHAKSMLDHAKSCQKEGKASGMDHLKEAIAQEEKAVDHGEAGHLDIALKHAQDALMHAKQVK